MEKEVKIDFSKRQRVELTTLEKISQYKTGIIIGGLVLAALVYITTFFIVNQADVEGEVFGKRMDQGHLRYFLDSRNIFKKEKGREVLDYIEYSVLEHRDGADYIIYIGRPKKNDPDQLIRFNVHVSKETFESYSIGDYFIADSRTRGDSLKESNNRSGMVLNWTREKPDMDTWKAREY